MSKQKQSAAEAYRALRRQNLDKTGELVKLPSGIEFELRRVDVQAYVRAGRLPDSLLRRGISGWQKMAELVEENPEGLTEKDSRDALETVIFMREIVTESCVNPRLVVGSEADDELDPKYLSEEDFGYIFAFATNQEKGGQAEGLEKFRRK